LHSLRRCSLLPRLSCPLNIPHHGVSRFRILGCPSHFPFGICHQTAGVAINQPHGIHRITSVILMFWLLSPYHLWFSYMIPGPATSPRYPSVKRTSGFPSHLPLGICHQIAGVSIYPLRIMELFVTTLAVSFLWLFHRPTKDLVTAWLFQFSLPVYLSRFGPHTSLITFVTRS